MSPLDRLLPYLLIAALVFSALFGVYWYGGSVERSRWEAKWSDRDSKDVAARLQAEVDARTLEQKYQQTVEEARSNGQQKIDSINGLLVSANAQFDSVQQRANQLAEGLARKSKSLNSCTAAASEAAAETARVLARLFNEADTTAGILAETAEQARARGLTCEQAYDGLLANSKKK